MSRQGQIQLFKVKITQLKISPPFLKIFAQNISNKHYADLNRLKDLYHKSEILRPESGEICVAHVAKDQYERCRVIQMDVIDKTAFLYFVDCGYYGTLSLSEVSQGTFSQIIFVIV